MLFSDEQLLIVRFCAVECEHQRSGERSVAWMVQAWQYAMSRAASVVLPDQDDVLILGSFVEPLKNNRGYRQQQVSFRREDGPPEPGGADWRDIPRLVTSLLLSIDEYEPAEWYREFEEIHPFLDGNGRVGQCLFNWLNGSLLTPEPAPAFGDNDRRARLL